MEIKLKFRNCVYAICIGYKTPWFSQAYFMTIQKEWYDNREVSFAVMVFHT